MEEKNTTVDAIISEVTHESYLLNTDEGPCLPGLATIKTIFDNTPGMCPGRQVFIACFVWYGQYHSMGTIGAETEIPREFLYGLASEMMNCRKQPTDNLPHEDKIRYHESETGYNGWASWDMLCYRSAYRGNWDEGEDED
jgi:hypothetical protein